MRQILCVLAIAACSHTSPTRSVPSVPAPHAAAAKPIVTERFDDQVREDLFQGLRGDVEALERAMKLCEDTLAKHPEHPQAMVWHGAGLIGRASIAFRAGDRTSGIVLYTRGLAEMDAAVALAPDDIGVRIPRGAVVLNVATFVPEPEKTKLLERGVADFEVTYAAQKAEFKTLTLHAREKLLYGLTDAYAHLGRRDRAEHYFERMKVDAADSELLDRAASRARGETVDAVACEQCHRAM